MTVNPASHTKFLNSPCLSRTCQIEQLFQRARLRQRLAIAAQRLGFWNRVLQPQTEKPHEGQPIAKLIFCLIIEDLERLQHQRLEDHPKACPRRTLAFRVAPEVLL